MFSCRHRWNLFAVTYQESHSSLYEGKEYFSGHCTTFVTKCAKCGDLRVTQASGKLMREDEFTFKKVPLVHL